MSQSKNPLRAVGALVAKLSGKSASRKAPLPSASRGTRGKSQGSLHPFRRAIEYREKMDKIIAEIGSELDRKIAIDALGPYVGRGKGRSKGHTSRNYLRRSRSKYEPHQKYQECIRRVIGGWHTQRVTKASVLAAAPAHVTLSMLISNGGKV